MLEPELEARLEGIEPGREQRLQCGRDGGLGREAVEGTVVDEGPASTGHRHQLSQVQRVAPGPIDQEVGGLGGQRLVTDECPRQRDGVGPTESFQADRRRRRKPGQPLPGLGATGQDGEKGDVVQAAGQFAQELEGAVTAVVHVVDDQQQRVVRPLLLHQANEGPELFLLYRGRIDRLQRRIHLAGDRPQPGVDLAVVGRSELADDFAGHPRASHRAVGRVRHPDHFAPGGPDPRQLVEQSGLP